MSKFTITQIGQQLKCYGEFKEKLLAHYGDLDPETITDTLEGATDLHEYCIVAAEEVKEYEAMVDGLKMYIEDLGRRKARLERSAETLRAVITQAMDKAGIETITSPVLTLSKRDIQPKPIILEEADIPAEYWKPQDPKLDKNALAEALRDGENVPGTTLDNGGVGLTIRVK